MNLEPKACQLPNQLREKLREHGSMAAFSHIIVRDGDGRIAYWSDANAEHYGWTENEALGENADRLLRAELPDSRENLERRVRAEGKWEGEIVYRDRAGARHFLQSTWTPYLGDDGHVAATIEVNCDISKQKAVEASLRARDRDFRAFFELSGVGNVIADAATGRFLTVNQTFCDLTGYSAAELRDLDGLALTHPDDRERDAAGWTASVEQGRPHHTIEKRYVCKDGRIVWVSVTSTIIRDDEGVPIYAAGVAIDVDARHETLAAGIEGAPADLEGSMAERTSALREVVAKLDQNQKKFETLIDASPAAVVALDHDQRVEMWNPEAEALFGLSEEASCGRKFMELPIDWNHPSALATLLLSREPRQINLSVSLDGGRVREVGVWSASYPARDDIPGGHVLLMLDDTEKKFLEHALLDSGEREQRRIGQELHEQLAQQLVGVALGVQALSKELSAAHSPSAKKTDELVRLINDCVVRARDMARAINPIEVDSAGLMSALREFVSRAPAHPHVELDCAEEVPVHRSSVALHAFRIVQEAVTNAIRHAQAKRVTIRISQPANEVHLSIEDDGRGIPPQTARDAEVGIGIMKYRAQAIRGELMVEPRPGAGTIVTCVFPNPV